MSNTQKPPYFSDALWEVKQEILRIQVRFDEYDKVRDHQNNPYSFDTPRQRGAIRRASLDLSAALVKLRKASV